MVIHAPVHFWGEGGPPATIMYGRVTLISHSTFSVETFKKKLEGAIPLLSYGE